MNILLVEDDLDLGNGVRIALAEQRFDVVWVRLLTEAVRELDTTLVDLVLLDIGLPDGDGLALLKRLREGHRTVPVLMLTARDALDDRLGALDGGADDYLVKPFALAELLSRVRALNRRAYGFAAETVELNGLLLNLATLRVSVRGVAIDLSRTEFMLLAALVKRADRVLTRRTLEEQVLPNGAAHESNVLDVHISNLRKKIGEGYVRTVRGVGYVIDREPAAAVAAPTVTRGP